MKLTSLESLGAHKNPLNFNFLGADSRRPYHIIWGKVLDHSILCVQVSCYTCSHFMISRGLKVLQWDIKLYHYL